MISLPQWMEPTPRRPRTISADWPPFRLPARRFPCPSSPIHLASAWTQSTRTHTLSRAPPSPLFPSLIRFPPRTQRSTAASAALRRELLSGEFSCHRPPSPNPPHTKPPHHHTRPPRVSPGEPSASPSRPAPSPMTTVAFN